MAILDFTHNAMANITSGHTIMSGISENHMVDTKSWISLCSSENDIILIFDLGQNEGHFYVLRQHF